MKFISKLIGKFRKENKKQKFSEYVDHDTECDKCEYLNDCIDLGYVLDATRYCDERMHYIKGRGCECKK